MTTKKPEAFPASMRARISLAIAVLVGMVGSSASAQGTKGVSLQPGEHGPRLAIEVNGKKLTEWTVMSLPDTILVTTSPQDSLGNSIPLTGFEIPISALSIGAAILVSCSVGVIFGFLPASRAANLNPTDALRYE